MFTSSTARNAQPREHIGLYVWCSFLGIIFIGLAGLVLRFPFFRYQRVEVTGDTRVSHADIAAELRAYPLATAFGRLLGYNHFFLWGSSPITLPETLLARVDIRRDFIRRTLRVTATDRARALVWCDEATHCVWVDVRGVAFERAPFAEGQLITVVVEREREVPQLGSDVLPEVQFGHLTHAIALVQNAGLPLDKVLLNREAAEAQVALQRGPSLLFSLRFDPSFAEAALAALMERKEFYDIAEIDFRVERKAYYKTR